jgi:pSer/pThr/pTyr-binding forkhead associated (FHA) protein
MSTPMLTNEDALDRHASSGAVADEGCVPGVEGWASDSAVLVVKRGPNAGSRFRLNQAVTSVGRHPTSDIFLDDITVSRRHSEFHRDSREIRVVDIGSFSGTLVNQKPVDSVVLADGDEIQIGKFRLVLRTATQPLGAPLSERSPGPLTRIPPEATGCGNGTPATSSLPEKTRPRP